MQSGSTNGEKLTLLQVKRKIPFIPTVISGLTQLHE